MKNYQIVLTTFVSFFIAYSVLVGIAQQYVHFAGSLNEMAVFILASTMGFMSLFGWNWKGLWNWLVKS